MTDFAKIAAEAKAAQEAARLADHEKKEAEREAFVADRLAKIQPLLDIAVPVFEKAKADLAPVGIDVSWTENSRSHNANEVPMIELRLKPKTGSQRGFAMLNRAGDKAVLRYRKISDHHGGLSIGNVDFDDFSAADAERLVTHCIEDLYPKP